MNPSDMFPLIIPLQTFVQLLAAIYFSLSVDGLLTRLYQVADTAKKKSEDVKSRIRLRTTNADNSALFDKLSLYCNQITITDIFLIKIFARLGFFLCLAFLFFTGLYRLSNELYSVCQFFDTHWIAIIILLIFPLLLSLFLFRRPCRWILRAEKKIDAINDECQIYLQYVTKDEMNEIQNATLRKILIKGARSKKPADYYNEVEQWRITSIKRYINRITTSAFIATICLRFSKRVNNM